MNKIIIANWKLNPLTEKDAVRLATASDVSGVVICPPFPFLEKVHGALKKAALGAQDIFWESSGAYTGEVSAPMLKNFGVSYVIIGHSERRALGETDSDINKKVKAALVAGLKVILCVGEPWAIKKKGLAAAKNFVAGQIKKDLAGLKSLVINHKSLTIAYEPIWAIGTGKNDKPENTAEMVKFIKKLLVSSHKSKVSVLYGGSVNAKNIADFLERGCVDGALVGGASLKPAEFKKIMKIAA